LELKIQKYIYSNQINNLQFFISCVNEQILVRGKLLAWVENATDAVWVTTGF
jgi:hypothetical protein